MYDHAGRGFAGLALALTVGAMAMSDFPEVGFTGGCGVARMGVGTVEHPHPALALDSQGHFFPDELLQQQR